jgi:hypothetical protein
MCSYLTLSMYSIESAENQQILIFVLVFGLTRSNMITDAVSTIYIVHNQLASPDNSSVCILTLKYAPERLRPIYLGMYH